MTDAWDPALLRAGVGGALEEFLAAQRERLRPLGPDADRLADAVAAAVDGGKRLRALFCAWGFGAVRTTTGPAQRAGLLRAAAALELLHASALVHDDLMDASDTRRGQPAVHRAFEQRHRGERWRGSPQQYGAAAAVLVGDLMLSWSDELLRGCGLDPAAVRHALQVFDVTRTEVVAGQFLDISVQARGDADEEMSMRVLRYKSAKYSVERPLHIGAALAGGTPAQLQALSDYGLPLGEAFQLRDDLLGVFGDPAVTGKPAGDDLSEGKRTVLVALALAQAEPADAKLLDEQLGRPLSAAEVARLQEVIERSGAPAQVESRITALTDRSLTALGQATSAGLITSAGCEALQRLAAAATQRRL